MSQQIIPKTKKTASASNDDDDYVDIDEDEEEDDDEEIIGASDEITPEKLQEFLNSKSIQKIF